jgi:hypothetical protein
VTWSSSRPDIATVYSNGLVIGTEFGTTEITASYAGAKARASVTVAEVGLSCVAPKGVPQGCPPPPPPPPVLY